MNYLIAGLGNIGAEYEHTRHNIGFDTVAFLANQHQAVFSSSRLAAKTHFKIKGRTLHLIQPSTYMNLSGKSIKYWLQMTKTAIINVLVITEDVSLPVSTRRLRKQGGDGGHNGRQADYVLSAWNDEEKAELPKHIEYAADAIVCFVLEGLDRAMNKFNTKK